MKPGLPRSLAMLTVLIIAILGNIGASPARAARWGEDYFPNLPLVTHEGKKIRFYKDAIKGKIVVVNFIYTSCPDICSLATARMAQVRQRLGDRVGRDIFIYSITLDPKNDTPEVLKEYADAFHAGDGWTFLTGDPGNVDKIRFKLGERSRKLSEHRTDMVIGNDSTGEWQRISLMGNLKIVAQKILEMDPEYRAQKRTVAVRDPEEMARTLRIDPNQRGQALFLKACSSCHTVGRGDLVGPDLKGLADRRELTWLIRYLKDPVKLRAEKDPIALALDAQYKGVKMPFLGLSDVDAEDVLAYIRAQEMLMEQAAKGAAGQDHHHGHHSHHENGHDGHHGHGDHGSHEGHQAHEGH